MDKEKEQTPPHRAGATSPCRSGGCTGPLPSVSVKANRNVRDNVQPMAPTMTKSSSAAHSPSRAAKDPAASVGPRIRALRDAMGLSLSDLAERSAVSAPMLSQVERGETSPTLAVAAKIASGLELTLSQLLRLDEGQHVAISRAA